MFLISNLSLCFSESLKPDWETTVQFIQDLIKGEVAEFQIEKNKNIYHKPTLIFNKSAMTLTVKYVLTWSKISAKPGQGDEERTDVYDLTTLSKIIGKEDKDFTKPAFVTSFCHAIIFSNKTTMDKFIKAMTHLCNIARETGSLF
jgi:hypothetical protein